MKRTVSVFMLLYLLTMCLGTVLTSCSSVPPKESISENDINENVEKGKNVANQNAVDVTMIQLITTPEKYNGVLIRVIGVGNLEFEGNYLSLSKEDHKYSTGNQIWIELSDKAISYSKAQEYNGRYVIVEGYFDKDDSGHMGLFHGAIKEISRYELWKHEQ